MTIALAGRHALVTGGGRGIGEAVARTLHGAGARVTIVDRNEAGAVSVATSLGGRGWGLDISDDVAVATVVAAIEKDVGPIDILVSCAGNLQNLDRAEDLPMTIWDKITDVHLRGTYAVTVEVGRRMVQRRKGSIVTIASTAGMRSTPLHAYAPAKAALIMQAQCLASEWGWAGVRVNCVSPGFVPTPGVSRGFAAGVMDEQRCIRGSALQRLVQPEEIATAVLFLASEMAAAITGVNLPVDAGWLVGTNWDSYGGLRQQPPGKA
jgi:NAD(P)-dependent dehydrogenase (short-subunit alcohol dehydrogenase family)